MSPKRRAFLSTRDRSVEIRARLSEERFLPQERGNLRSLYFPFSYIPNDQVEAVEENAKKTKSFFIYAVDNWDAEFYAKVNDDVYVNLDALGGVLTSHLHKPRVYIGCMKSGEVFSEPTHKWHEPDWWKFGDGKSYFRHASGEVYVISKALAQFISINRFILRTYAHDD
ncbi:putative beta-galactosyltransferase 11-like protein, partial [Trifolium pratense]